MGITIQQKSESDISAEQTAESQESTTFEQEIDQQRTSRGDYYMINYLFGDSILVAFGFFLLLILPILAVIYGTIYLTKKTY